jgi:phosphoribosylformylglycinamidine cyclo-ligase
MAMNLDDVACSGGVDGLFLSNTIGRNRSLVPDSAVAEIVAGYREYAEILAAEGVQIQLGGGETADMSDLVRTVVVDSTLCSRIPRSQLVDTWRVTPGDVIVGFSSTGKARYEAKENSGVGSNGLTLARHVVLTSEYVLQYPEIVDPALSKELAYRGSFKLSDTPHGLGMSIGEALLSPTRSYTPLIKVLLSTLGEKIHSLIHCTGGGQAKIKRFGRGVRYEKHNLFPTPAIFSLIQSHGKIPWEEMYAVFNMGHRLEACVDPASADQVIALSEQFGIAAQVVGRVTSSDTGNEVIISSPHGVFRYS